MKQTYDLLSEALSLPFSELFLKHDYFADCIPEDDGNRYFQQTAWTVELSNNIRALSERVAGYIDRRTMLFNVDDLQSIIHYVYNAEDVTELLREVYSASPTALPDNLSRANYYYVMLLKRTAKTFLSTRNGKAVVKYWDGSSEAYDGIDILPSGRSRPLWDRDILGRQPGPHRVEAWHSLGQCLPESLLMSAYAACLSETSPLPTCGEQQDSCVRTLFHFGETVNISDLLLDKVLDRGMAETHLHAGASRSFDLIWEADLWDALNGASPMRGNHDTIFRDEIKEKVYQRHTLNAVILRAVLAAFLVSGYPSLKEFVRLDAVFDGLLVPRTFLSALDGLSFSKPSICDFSDAVLWRKPFMERLGRGHGDLADILDLRRDLTRADIGLAERCFLAWSILYITRTPEDGGFAAAFIHYLRLKNYSYRSRIQDSKNKGLTYFRKFFATSTDMGRRKADERFFHIIYTALRDERVEKTELRFSPPGSKHETIADAERDIYLKLQAHILQFICQHIHSIAVTHTKDFTEEKTSFSEKWKQALRKIDAGRQDVLTSLLWDEYHVDPNLVRPHRLGIIYHMVKKGETNEKPSCFLQERRLSEKDQYAAFSFGTARFQYEAAVRAIVRLRRLCPAVGRLVVGIDAASAELPTDPWVFAPVFRMAREPEPVPKGEEFLQQSGEQRMLGITYHVGEEFRHPLSGLRHVDEAISFFKLHAGDRLGHALALGIDLDRWADRHKMVAIPCQEWLEDCLWAWTLAGQSSENGELSEYITFLETQINSCARRIYGTLDGITIKKLYTAYHSKTLSHKDLCAIAERWQRQNRYSLCDCPKHTEIGSFFPCVQSNNPDRRTWWNEDSLIMSHHCAKYKSRMEAEIMREITPHEIELCRRVQNYLRRLIAGKGVVLEENPSSNVLIGEMGGVLTHPICGLRSSNDGYPVVMATINTDDPSVFHSNVANEHALIYYALLHHGYSVEDALKAVDEIRANGLLSSFLDDASPFELQLNDYEQILRFVRRR